MGEGPHISTDLQSFSGLVPQISLISLFSFLNCHCCGCEGYSCSFMCVSVFALLFISLPHQEVVTLNLTGK